jgi:hypothetical protein
MIYECIKQSGTPVRHSTEGRSALMIKTARDLYLRCWHRPETSCIVTSTGSLGATSPLSKSLQTPVSACSSAGTFDYYNPCVLTGASVSKNVKGCTEVTRRGQNGGAYTLQKRLLHSLYGRKAHERTKRCLSIPPLIFCVPRLLAGSSPTLYLRRPNPKNPRPVGRLMRLSQGGCPSTAQESQPCKSRRGPS